MCPKVIKFLFLWAKYNFLVMTIIFLSVDSDENVLYYILRKNCLFSGCSSSFGIISEIKSLKRGHFLKNDEKCVIFPQNSAFRFRVLGRALKKKWTLLTLIFLFIRIIYMLSAKRNKI